MHLQNILSIHRHYDHVYVSPHFDDVAASCSGRIFKQLNQNESVLIITVFTAAGTHGSTTFSNALKSILNYKRRREEDCTAMQRMGADYLWLEHPEVLFRNQKSWARYRPHYRATPSNKILCDKLIRDLHEICRQTDCANLILPLGIGQHMDHQILFQAGITLLHGKNRTCRILFYEETPYALFPFLLTYRLKKTGIRCTFLCGQHRQTDSTSQLSAKEIFRLGSSIPSLGIHRTTIKPWAFLLIIWFNFYTRYLMKASSGFFDHHPPLPKVCDITPFIDRKLLVISTYTSQLAGPMVNEQRIKAGLSTYASTLGMPKGSFGERYWTTSDPNIL
jgi:LmbE family N-acetylglucosaminyl deacetylase